MDFNESIEKTISQINNVMSANCIIGEAIETETKVLIPISKTALAFAVGVGSSEDNDEKAGAGGGASIDPIAFVVIHKDVEGPGGVEILPVVGKNALDDVIYNVGKTVGDKLASVKSSKCCKGKSSDDDEDDVDVDIDDVKTKIKEE